MYSHNAIENVVHQIFDKYNGKINVFNRAMLDIDWGFKLYDQASQLGGITTHPNIVVVYPRVIEAITKNWDEFKYVMLITLIHELHHVDQVIDYAKMRHDFEYRMFIESVAETETYMYIAQHCSEIQKVFGINCMIPHGEYYEVITRMGYETGTLFQRRDYISHFILMVQDMLSIHRTDLINRLEDVMTSASTRLMVRLDNIEFYVKWDDKAMPLDQLNQLLYDNYFRFNMRGARGQLSSKDCITWLLKIRSNCSNRLYKIIAAKEW